jgi:hypothetical protein
MATQPHRTPARPAVRPEAEAAPEPQASAAEGSVPVPRQSENDLFVQQQMAGTLPRPPWFHKADGSPIDQSSHDPSPPGTPTWP